jgi:hypothetical protein
MLGNVKHFFCEFGYILLIKQGNLVRQKFAKIWQNRGINRASNLSKNDNFEARFCQKMTILCHDFVKKFEAYL